MSTSTVDKKRVASEDLQASTEEQSKKIKASSFGRDFSHLTKSSKPVFLKVTGIVAGQLFHTVSNLGFSEKAAFAVKHGGFKEQGADLYSHWRQAFEGDRPSDLDMPYSFNPKHAFEQAWLDLSGTMTKEIADDLFLDRVTTFIETKSDFVEEFCTKQEGFSIAKLQADAEKELSQSSSSSSSSSSEGKKAEIA